MICKLRIMMMMVMMILLQLTEFQVEAQETVLQDDSGSIYYVPKFLSAYNFTWTNASWFINSTDKIKLTIHKFNLEYCCPYVQLYDSFNSEISESPKFIVASRDDANSEFYLQGPVRIELITESGITFETFGAGGFRAEYQTLIDKEFSESSQIFVSPTAGIINSHSDYGIKNYPKGLMKSWSFIVDSQNTIEMNFLEFSTHSPNDIVQIYAGIPPKLDNDPIFEFSGSGLSSDKSNISHRGNVTVVMRSGNQGNDKGFRFLYRVVTDSTLSLPNGSIISKTIPQTSNDFDSANDSWLINISAPIRMIFTELNLPSCCAEVKVYDTDNSKSVMKLRLVLNGIVNNGEYMNLIQGPVRVQFVSNGTTVHQTGFRLQYEIDERFGHLFRPSALCQIVSDFNMKLLYKFGSFGSTNLVNSVLYNFKNLENVILDSNGAHFMNSTSDMKVDIPGFESIVGFGNKYSIFMKIKRKSEFKVSFKDARNQYPVKFYVSKDSPRVRLLDTKLGTRYYKNYNLPRITATNQDLGVGFTFDGTDVQNLYRDGRFYESEYEIWESPSSSYIPRAMKELQIDNYGQDNSTVFCFAVSSRILNLEEFQQLNNWC